MPSQYLSLRESYSDVDFSLSTLAGGNTTSSISLNFYILGKNRAGFNRVSNPIPFIVNAGNKLTVTLSVGLRNTGEDLHQLVLAAEDTGNSVDAVILAVWNAKEADQVTDRSLPATIELTDDEHFLLNAAVNNTAEFPNFPINGMVREVIEDSTLYQYNDELSEWNPIATNSAYVSSTTDLGGCDRSLSLVEDPLIPPDTSANQFSTPIKIAFFNGYLEDSGVALQAGEQFGLLFFVNGQQTINGIEYANLLAGFVRITLLGYVRRATGELDTNINGSGTPLTWFPNKGLIELPADLPRGYGAAWEISLNLDSDRLAGLVPSGSIVSFNLYNQGLIGSPTDIGRVTGDVVFNEGDRLRIVPNKRLGGVGVVGGSSQAYYLTPTLQEANLFGLLLDSADQQIAISGLLGGRVSVRASGTTLQPTEALRAVVSTEPGISKASDFTPGVTLTANQRLRVDITLPVDGELQGTVRNDYPDVIAGTPNVVFNVPSLIPYISFNGSIYQMPPVTIAAAASISFTINSLSSGTIISNTSTPTNDFGLFGYSTISAAAEESGSLAAGDYQVAIAWFYPSPNFALTKISHSTQLGCIPEFNQTLAELLQTARSFAIDANSTAELESITAEVLATNPVVILNRSETEKELYAYFPNFSGTIDGESAIALSNGSGAMVRISSASTTPTEPTTAFNPDTILVGPSGEILVSPEGFVLTSELPSTPPTTSVLIDTVPLTNLLFSESGQLLFSLDGSILLESENSITQTDETSSAIVELNQLLISPSGDLLLSPQGIPLVSSEVSSSDPLVLRKSDLDRILISPSGDFLLTNDGEFLLTNE
ncbi:MAG: hypothetical protein QNJ38_01375 [Prochloraceae cyanobacterium]|nr:hypothetical protein [Prochloraceae cyanobacterium]